MSTFVKSAYPLPRKGCALFYRITDYVDTINQDDSLHIFEGTHYNDSENISKISNTQIKLKANRKYKLTSSLITLFSGTTASNGEYQFYNASSASYVGILGHTADYQFSYDTSGGYTPANVILAPTTDILIELKFSRLVNTITTLSSLGSYVEIEELEAYLPASTGTQNINGNIIATGSVSGSSIVDTSLTTSTVPYANADKKLVSSSITPTELGYLSGSTSNIQAQLSGLEGYFTSGAANISLHTKTIPVFGTLDTPIDAIVLMNTQGNGEYLIYSMAHDPLYSESGTTDHYYYATVTGANVEFGYCDIHLRLSNSYRVWEGRYDSNVWQGWTYITDASGNAVNANGIIEAGTTTSIKIKKLTGTTASTQGGVASVNHGITGDKIISISVKVIYITNRGVPNSYTKDAGYEFTFYHNETQVVVENSASNSDRILSKPFIVTIIYEA